MAKARRIDPNEPHGFRPGQRYEEGAPCCADCGMTFTLGQHGEKRREVPLFLDDEIQPELITTASGSHPSGGDA